MRLKIPRLPGSTRPPTTTHKATSTGSAARRGHRPSRPGHPTGGPGTRRAGGSTIAGRPARRRRPDRLPAEHAAPGQHDHRERQPDPAGQHPGRRDPRHGRPRHRGTAPDAARGRVSRHRPPADQRRARAGGAVRTSAAEQPGPVDGRSGPNWPPSAWVVRHACCQPSTTTGSRVAPSWVAAQPGLCSGGGQQSPGVAGAGVAQVTGVLVRTAAAVPSTTSTRRRDQRHRREQSDASRLTCVLPASTTVASPQTRAVDRTPSASSRAVAFTAVGSVSSPTARAGPEPHRVRDHRRRSAAGSSVTPVTATRRCRSAPARRSGRSPGRPRSASSTVKGSCPVTIGANPRPVAVEPAVRGVPARPPRPGWAPRVGVGSQPHLEAAHPCGPEPVQVEPRVQVGQGRGPGGAGVGVDRGQRGGPQVRVAAGRSGGDRELSRRGAPPARAGPAARTRTGPS